MIDLLSNLVLWILTHGQTCISLAFAFLLGGLWGMWIQFNVNDKQKDAHQSAIR